MASTDQAGFLLPNVGVHHAGGIEFACGRATLSAGGTVDVVTGLNSVMGLVATEIGTLTATEATVFQVNEDLPLASGTVTVKGETVDEGAPGTVKAANAQQFCWFAWGYR